MASDDPRPVWVQLQEILEDVDNGHRERINDAHAFAGKEVRNTIQRLQDEVAELTRWRAVAAAALARIEELAAQRAEQAEARARRAEAQINVDLGHHRDRIETAERERDEARAESISWQNAFSTEKATVERVWALCQRWFDNGAAACAEELNDALSTPAPEARPSIIGTPRAPCMVCATCGRHSQTEAEHLGHECEPEARPSFYSVTFEQLLAHGIAQGVPLVNGMPWSFAWNGYPVTHENDDCYLLTENGVSRRVERTKPEARPSPKVDSAEALRAEFAVHDREHAAPKGGSASVPAAETRACSSATSAATLTEPPPQPAAEHALGEVTSGDTLFLRQFGTVRACIDCGGLIAGGPTRCVHCVKASPTPSRSVPLTGELDALLRAAVGYEQTGRADPAKVRMKAWARSPAGRDFAKNGGSK